MESPIGPELAQPAIFRPRGRPTLEMQGTDGTFTNFRTLKGWTWQSGNVPSVPRTLAIYEDDFRAASALKRHLQRDTGIVDLRHQLTIGARFEVDQAVTLQVSQGTRKI